MIKKFAASSGDTTSKHDGLGMSGTRPINLFLDKNISKSISAGVSVGCELL